MKFLFESKRPLLSYEVTKTTVEASNIEEAKKKYAENSNNVIECNGEVLSKNGIEVVYSDLETPDFDPQFIQPVTDKQLVIPDYMKIDRDDDETFNKYADHNIMLSEKRVYGDKLFLIKGEELIDMGFKPNIDSLVLNAQTFGSCKSSLAESLPELEDEDEIADFVIENYDNILNTYDGSDDNTNLVMHMVDIFKKGL